MASITLSLRDPQPACNSSGTAATTGDVLALVLDETKYSSVPVNPVYATIDTITPNANVYDPWNGVTGPGDDYALTVNDAHLPSVGGSPVADINECDLESKPYCAGCCGITDLQDGGVVDADPTVIVSPLEGDTVIKKNASGGLEFWKYTSSNWVQTFKYP